MHAYIWHTGRSNRTPLFAGPKAEWTQFIPSLTFTRETSCKFYRVWFLSTIIEVRNKALEHCNGLTSCVPLLRFCIWTPMTLVCNWALELLLTIFSRNSNSHCSGAPVGCRLIEGKMQRPACSSLGSLADAGVWMSMATGILLENCRFVDNWLFQIRWKGPFLKETEA